MSNSRPWAAAVGVAGVVVAASLVPLSNGPAGGGVLGPPGTDTLLHAAGYAAVAYCFARVRAAGGADPTAAALAANLAGAAAGGLAWLSRSRGQTRSNDRQ